MIKEKFKVFISQPMAGLSNEEIMSTRKKAIAETEKILGERINPVTSYFDMYVNENKNSTALSSLGRSIEYLGLADFAYFVKGWQDARGCRIEHLCCEEYGIPILEGKV